MKIGEKFKGLRIGQKIFLSNVILFVIPCVVLSVVLFGFIKKEAGEELDHSELMILNQIDESYEKMFREIVSYSSYFYLNADINKMLSKKEYDSEYDAMQAEKKIKEYFVSSRTIYSNMEYGMRLMGSNGYNYTSLNEEQTTCKYPELDKLEQEPWFDSLEESGNKIQYIPWYLSKELQKTDGDTSVHGFRYIKNLNSGRYVGLMDIIIEQEKLKSLMLNATHENREKVVMLDETGRIITGTDESIKENTRLDRNIVDRLSSGEEGVFQEKISGALRRIYFVTNKTTGWKIIRYSEAAKSIWANNRTFLIFFGISIAYLGLALIMSAFNAKFISKPLTELKKDIHTIYKGDLSVRTQVGPMDEFGELNLQFNKMISRIQDLIDKLEQKEEEKRTLEMKALQEQIKPHFLFNTLASIRFLIEMDMNEKAQKSLLALAGLLKGTYSDYRKLIPVKEEIESVEKYLILMDNRYQDTFDWQIRMDEAIQNCQIPRISVQPLVENCILHGFNGKEGAGHIIIEGCREGNTAVICVSDDGSGENLEKIRELIENPMVEESGKFSSIGVQNVQKRLVLYFGTAYGLSAYKNGKDGISIEIRIPFSYEAKERSGNMEEKDADHYSG